MFRGPVPPREMGSVFRCGDVLCLPSRVDGWGVVVNEAASMGLALIASEHAGTARHLIECAVNGYRVRGGSVRSLADAMQTYVNNPGMARLHGERSLGIIQDYAPDRNADRFLCAAETWLEGWRQAAQCIPPPDAHRLMRCRD